MNVTEEMNIFEVGSDLDSGGTFSSDPYPDRYGVIRYIVTPASELPA
jgi:hypothetical protein